VALALLAELKEGSMNARMIRSMTTCAFVISSVLFWPAQSAADESDQRGKFRVGHTRIEVILTGSVGERRPIDVEIWYPANTKGFNAAPVTVYRSRLFGVPLIPARWDPLSWQITSGVAKENVQIRARGRAFPVVIFSHGAGSSPLDYIPTLEHLASHGYVVAAPWHTRNNQDDTRTNFINNQAGFRVFPCLDGRPTPCMGQTPQAIGANRIRDLGAIADTLPSLFGTRVNVERIGVMGHSAGSLTAVLAAGGSTSWGIPPDPRVDSILGLAMISDDIIDQVDLAKVTVPALLIAAEFDANTPPARSVRVYNGVSSTEKAYVLLSNAVHRSFSSSFCSQMQAAGAIAQSDPTRAILDRHTLTNVLVSTPENGSTLDYCADDYFTHPVDIRPIVSSMTGFNVTESNVPRLGVASDEVNRLVSELAVAFFDSTLHVRCKQYLGAKFMRKYERFIEFADRQPSSKTCHDDRERDDD